MNRKNTNGSTALILACLFGKIKVVRYLLEQGAVVSLRDKDGCSALDTVLRSAKKVNQKEWLELFALYEDQFDQKDLKRYKEHRLAILF
jgi:ankyrin repeat protein